MKATDILSSEHRVIERVIAALESASDRLEAGQPVRAGFFLDAADFIKGFADGFVKTDLEKVLSGLGITDLLVCGMMTQNCVTHTAISKSAEKYRVCILPDCCTTVDAMIHNMALNAVSTRLPLVPSIGAV